MTRGRKWRSKSHMQDVLYMLVRKGLRATKRSGKRPVEQIVKLFITDLTKHRELRTVLVRVEAK